MKCRFCKEELPEGASVCPNCGTPVEPETPGTPKTPETSETPGLPKLVEDKEERSGSGEQSGQSGSPEDSCPPRYQYGPPKQGKTDPGSYQYGAPPSGPDHRQYNTPEKGGQGRSGGGINGTLYMVFAVLTTFFCCLPLGIAAIIYAGKINEYQRRGDYAGAHDAASKSKLFSILGAAGGLVITVIYIAVFVMGAKEYGFLKEGTFSGSGFQEFLEEYGKNYGDPGNDAAGGWGYGGQDGKRDQEDHDEYSGAEAAEQKDELGDTWDSYTLQINDKVVTLPCRIRDLEAAGLEMDKDETPENDAVDAGESVTGYFEDRNDNYIIVDMVNTTEDRLPVKDCLVGKITAMDYSISEKGRDGRITVILPGGIRIGTDQEELLGKYGKTDDVYEGDNLLTYVWHKEEGGHHSECEIDMDAGSRQITGITIRNHEVKKTKNEKMESSDAS